MQEAQENLSVLFFRLLKYLGTTFEFLRPYPNESWTQRFLKFSYHKASGSFFVQLATEWQRTCCRRVCSVVSFGPQMLCIEKGPGSLCRGAWFLLPPQVPDSLLMSRSSGWPGVSGTWGPGVERGHGVTLKVVNRSTYACTYVSVYLSNIFAISGLLWGEKFPVETSFIRLHHHNRQLRLSVSETKKNMGPSLYSWLFIMTWPCCLSRTCGFINQDFSFRVDWCNM